MDLKQSKPIHVRCPKCGHDVSINGNHIEEEYQKLKAKVTSLNSEINKSKAEGLHKNSPKIKRLTYLLEDAKMQLAAIKKVRTNLIQNSELQRYEMFKNLVKAEIGHDRTIELLKEAEDEMVFREYDLAKQKFTNFNGV